MRVPSAEEMDDDIFLKHVDARHQELLNDKTARLQDHPHPAPGWVEPYRAAHGAYHRLYPRMHDHRHLED